jgi:hypothetical protein
MATNGSPPGRRRRCGAVTRVDLVTILVAAMLCSASYCLGIWHNSRGAADSRVLGASVALAAAAACRSDDPLDFEAHHNAEGAGLSVSLSSSTAGTTTRRALRGATPGGTGYRGCWAGIVGGGGGFRFSGTVRA